MCYFRIFTQLYLESSPCNYLNCTEFNNEFTWQETTCSYHILKLLVEKTDMVLLSIRFSVHMLKDVTSRPTRMILFFYGIDTLE